MEELRFDITYPVQIDQFFNVLEDKSVWFEKDKYVRRGKNWVPNREFTLRFNELLIPKTEKIKRGNGIINNVPRIIETISLVIKK